jgi:sulfate adenylyltransferase subunit 2
MREVVAECEKPVMLYSIGKDSSVMLHLAAKAFYPAKPPFPLLHVDTTWKFKEMYAIPRPDGARARLRAARHRTPRPGARASIRSTTARSTPTCGRPGAEAGARQVRLRRRVRRRPARRGEEPRQGAHLLVPQRPARWDPKNQRPELWKLYNARKHKGESIRVFPISNWTELDIWQYIHLENIPIVPLYFAAERPVVERDGQLIMVDDERMPLRPGETPADAQGPLPHPRLLSAHRRGRERRRHPAADHPGDAAATTSERQGRVIDHDQAASMEKKKQEGYF